MIGPKVVNANRIGTLALDKELRRLPVGRELMVVLPNIEQRDTMLRQLLDATLRTETFLDYIGGEERVRLVEKPGAIGRWRESQGHWFYFIVTGKRQACLVTQEDVPQPEPKHEWLAWAETLEEDASLQAWIKKTA